MASSTENPPLDDAPSWLNKSLIEQALRKGGDIGANARVEALTICIATKPGDNYGSVIYRVKATLPSGKEHWLLVKTLPKSDNLVKSCEEGDVFNLETKMLAEYVPKITELLKKVSSKAIPPFAARCPSGGSTPTPFLVLEDLRPMGFKLANRQRGLGLRHSIITLRSLARFHAASAILVKENPNIANEFVNFFRTNQVMWKNLFSTTVEMSANVCRKIPDFQEYVEFLDGFKDRAVDVYAELNDPKPNGFNALIHGDFWANNMMFKYNEEGKPVDFRMVDFQLCHVASPAIDLIYFLTGSLREEVFINHERLLLREYHTVLSDTLQLFGSEAPSFQELMSDIHAHRAYAMFGTLCVWPFSKSDQVLDLDGALEGDSSSNSACYETDRMKEWLTYVLPEFKKRGWLDI